MAYVSQEQIDALKVSDGDTALDSDLNDTLDLIKSATDSVYVDTSGMLTVKEDCEAARDQAQLASLAAADSETAAANSAVEADGHSDKAEQWASHTPGELVPGETEYSAKHYALTASGNNTFVAGKMIDVVTTGTGPYVHTLDHAVVGAASVTLTGAQVFSSVTLDSDGHVTARAVRDLTPAEIGAGALATDNVWAGVNRFDNNVHLAPNMRITSPDENYTYIAAGATGGELSIGHHAISLDYCNYVSVKGRDSAFLGTSSFSWGFYISGTVCYVGRATGAGRASQVWIGSSTDVRINCWNNDDYYYRFVASAFYCSADGQWDLGQATKRWRNTYTITLYEGSSIQQKDIKGDIDTDWLYELDTFVYQWKADATPPGEEGKYRFGFSAEDVGAKAKGGRKERGGKQKQPMDKVGITDDDETSIANSQLSPVIVKALQEQKVQITALEEQVAELTARLEDCCGKK